VGLTSRSWRTTRSTRRSPVSAAERSCGAGHRCGSVGGLWKAGCVNAPGEWPS